MRNFLQIAAGLDVMPLLMALQRSPDLWNSNTVRTHHPMSAHRVVDDIVLRYNPFEPGEDFVDKVCSRIEVENMIAWYKLPQARQLAFWLMARTEGTHLGRVFISRMKPGVMIPPHSDLIPPAEEAFPDRTPPAKYYDRYHIPLQSQPGVIFQCGDEQVYMPPGTCFWFNNQEIHEVRNESTEDRIHLVIDIHH